MSERDPAFIAAAQRYVDSLTKQINDLTDEKDMYINEHGRCDRWMDGHSDRKCRRLKYHEGECSDWA